ncbi:helix-turn-helix transcriptional regulator [Parvibaculum sp.]|uniref:helix-turn-helix transcriptional regulator n=2 Tax=Parvibaculum sp. TaxID=2024848 RepID=UPI0025F7142F|nr:helix-turn-helix transcriptional regulator [Parvibaculum sp.]
MIATTLMDCIAAILAGGGARSAAVLGNPWTTEGLAAEIGMSRSAFASRFTEPVGEPPMRYLAKWRLTFAARRLLDTGEPVSRIAFEAGYESEAAFNRAFKRNFGAPPATWRSEHAAG